MTAATSQTTQVGNRLFLDTTSHRLMLAIQRPEDIVHGGPLHFGFTYQTPIHSQRQHSNILLPTLQEGLAQVHLTLKDVDTIVLNIGPGSFTGLRTGMTLIKAIGPFLQPTLYGFSAIHCTAGAWSCDPPPVATQVTEQTVSFALDARQDKVYWGTFSLHGEKPPNVSPLTLESVQHGLPEQNKSCPYIISQSLQKHRAFEALETPPIVWETWDPFTPKAMAWWLHYWPASCVPTPWDTLCPLYIQPPNITLKKTATTP